MSVALHLDYEDSDESYPVIYALDGTRGLGYPSLELETDIFDGETHNGVIPPAFGRGLRFVFR